LINLRSGTPVFCAPCVGSPVPLQRIAREGQRGVLDRDLKEDKMRYPERMPTDRFTELAEVAADQHGYFDLADSRAVGYADNTVAQMARRGRIERVSHALYRIAFLPSGRMGPYMAAVMWPVGIRGVISHNTALDLWDVGDVNPAKIHITVPRAHRPQREVPPAYEVHREDLDARDVTAIEGVPVVTLGRAIRECAAEHLAADLLEQAIRHGRDRGLLTGTEADGLMAELGVDRVAVGRA
jgi:predicted transcriptional regulator of viral defense system